MEKVLIYWSGGKDSAMAHYELTTNEKYRSYQITSLLTTLTEGYNRITGHGVRGTLLEQQAACLRLHLSKTFIPQRASMNQYELVIEEALRNALLEGIQIAATGDIFVEKQRMATFKKVGIRGCFPLMLHDTAAHMKRILALGFKMFVVCVDASVLARSFVGRVLDQDFLDALPLGIDPCGENGEFHTFVFDGPIFPEPLRCKMGEVVHREGFYFVDVLPAT